MDSNYHVEREFVRDHQGELLREAQESAFARRVKKAQRERLTAAIPEEVALALCADIRRGYRRYEPRAWRCALCVLLGKDGIPAQLAARPGNRGCDTVNRRYRLTSG
jgi:hypothetical protein